MFAAPQVVADLAGKTLDTFSNLEPPEQADLFRGISVSDHLWALTREVYRPLCNRVWRVNAVCPMPEYDVGDL
jgi:hypothetical protein